MAHTRERPSGCCRRGPSSKSNDAARMSASPGRRCACRKARSEIALRTWSRPRTWRNAIQATETVCSWVRRFAPTCGPRLSTRPTCPSPTSRGRPHARSRPHGRWRRTTGSCAQPTQTQRRNDPSSAPAHRQAPPAAIQRPNTAKPAGSHSPRSTASTSSSRAPLTSPRIWIRMARRLRSPSTWRSPRA